MDNKSLVIYTCFFGTNDNTSFIVSNIPSNNFPCYFYSNNNDILEIARNSGWQPIYVNKKIYDDNIKSAMQSKKVKTCPHLLDEIKDHDFNVYLDCKILANEQQILEIVDTLREKNGCYFLKLHPFLLPDIWLEFSEAMKQERYANQKGQYENYINKQIDQGLRSFTKRHFITGFIVRNQKNPKTKIINETWMKHIKECGIECQISFFFIAQIFPEDILADEKHSIELYCYWYNDLGQKMWKLIT